MIKKAKWRGKFCLLATAVLKDIKCLGLPGEEKVVETGEPFCKGVGRVVLGKTEKLL